MRITWKTWIDVKYEMNRCHFAYSTWIHANHVKYRNSTFFTWMTWFTWNTSQTYLTWFTYFTSIHVIHVVLTWFTWFPWITRNTWITWFMHDCKWYTWNHVKSCDSTYFKSIYVDSCPFTSIHCEINLIFVNRRESTWNSWKSRWIDSESRAIHQSRESTRIRVNPREPTWNECESTWFHVDSRRFTLIHMNRRESTWIT